MRALLVGLLLAVCGLVCASQQPPQPQVKVSPQGAGGEKSHTEAKTPYSAASKPMASTSQAVPPAQELPANDKEEHGEKHGRETITVLGFDFKVGESILIFATLLIFVATVGLVCATRDLVIDARESSKRSLRAYLGVSKSSVLAITHQFIQVQIEIENAGQTPAHNVIQAINAEIRVKGAAQIFKSPQSDRGPTVITHKGKLFLNFDIDQTNTQELKDIINGERDIFTWGWVSYEDIFGYPHRLEFRYQDVAAIWHSATGRPNDDLGGWVFQPMAEGNTST